MTTINSERRKKSLKRRIALGLASGAAIGLATSIGSGGYMLGYEVYGEPIELKVFHQIETALRNEGGEYRIYVNKVEELPRKLEKILTRHQKLLDERRIMLSDESFLKRKKDYESKIERDMEIPVKIGYGGLGLFASSTLTLLGWALIWPYFDRDKRKEDEIKTK